MIFYFPDLDTFRLALTGGTVPPAVSLAPAVVSFDDAGRPAVEPSAAPRNLAAALKRLGVSAVKTHFGTPETVTCWPQILPVHREAGVTASPAADAKVIPGQSPSLSAGVAVGPQTPVLFELADVQQLPVMVSEMLRLGNDRQGYRWLTAGDDERVLLRVIGPPYYSLLRALDTAGTPDASVRAYVERSPRVWVEVGFTHALAKQIQPPEDQMVLLRSPREWLYLSNTPFQDVYQILEFQLPDDPVVWEDSPLTGKLAVPLKLVPGNAAEAAELWVIRGDAVNQLDTLVRDADERLMNRLSFAVAEEDENGPTIVLRVRPSKLSPPVLELRDALGFKPYWKLPNLFLPMGTRLQPTLRREKVRQLLADDPNQLVWLYPMGLGRFTPESLPDDAFRPLEDWIEYVIDHQRKALGAWIEATAFDFEGFICKDEQSGGPKDGGPGKGRPKKKNDDKGDDEEASEPVPPPKKAGKKTAAPKNDEEFAGPAVIAPPSELKIRRDELEKEFLDFDGTLDAPERLAIWPELARIQAGLGDVADAAICWMNVIWENDEPPQAWATEWLRAGRKHAPRELSTEELDKYLNQPSPSPGELRAFVSLLVWACGQEQSFGVVHERLPRIQAFLESNEKLLGVRPIWLAWSRMANLADADVLGLARVRDRILNRLLEEGLNSERDLPTFLRFAGLRDSERMRVVRDRALKLRDLAMKWSSDVDVNKPYIDLMFAYGLARLGESTTAKELLASATTVLTAKKDEVHLYLLAAFQYRVETALAGKAHTGPLSRDLLDRFDKLEKFARYIVERMRQQSRILEPQEKFDPYRQWKKYDENDTHRELAELPDIKDPAKLADRIRKLLKDGVKGRMTPEIRLLVLTDSLTLSPRVNEDFTLELLQLVPTVLEASMSSSEATLLDSQGALLERALFLAAHFDRVEQVQALTGRFMMLVKGKTGKDLYSAINRLVGECLRSLRKLGLKDEIHKLLQQMSDLVVQGKSLPLLKSQNAANWTDLLGTLLNLASGWLYFGMVDQAMPFLDEARNELFAEGAIGDKGLKPMDYTVLARTYATVLGQGPVDMALTRIEELFRKMNKLPNTFTTAPYYSRLHLNIVEDVVRAIVSEDFALGPTARRWLDEDEYLVRRRIHRDMRKNLSQSGL